MLVMLIKNDGESTPPLGSVGEIVGVFEDDLLVEFSSHPCPAGPETAWLCPESWLMPLEDPGNRMVFIEDEKPQMFSITSDPSRW